MYSAIYNFFFMKKCLGRLDFGALRRQRRPQSLKNDYTIIYISFIKNVITLIKRIELTTLQMNELSLT